MSAERWRAMTETEQNLSNGLREVFLPEHKSRSGYCRAAQLLESKPKPRGWQHSPQSQGGAFNSLPPDLLPGSIYTVFFLFVCFVFFPRISNALNVSEVRTKPNGTLSKVCHGGGWGRRSLTCFEALAQWCIYSLVLAAPTHPHLLP